MHYRELILIFLTVILLSPAVCASPDWEVIAWVQGKQIRTAVINPNEFGIDVTLGIGFYQFGQLRTAGKDKTIISLPPSSVVLHSFRAGETNTHVYAQYGNKTRSRTIADYTNSPFVIEGDFVVRGGTTNRLLIRPDSLANATLKIDNRFSGEISRRDYPVDQVVFRKPLAELESDLTGWAFVYSPQPYLELEYTAPRAKPYDIINFKLDVEANDGMTSASYGLQSPCILVIDQRFNVREG